MVPCAEVTDWLAGQTEATVGAEVYKWLERVHGAGEQGLLITGGAVKVVIITSEFKEPSAVLIDTVQQALDPSAGEGEGIVPIGHIVHVSGVKNKTVDFIFTITYETGYTFETLRESIESAVDSYFLQLRQKWAKSDNIVVRVSQLESLLLGLEGIIDIENTRINGTAGNLVLGAEQIPVRGDING